MSQKVSLRFEKFTGRTSASTIWAASKFMISGLRMEGNTLEGVGMQGDTQYLACGSPGLMTTTFYCFLGIALLTWAWQQMENRVNMSTLWKT